MISQVGSPEKSLCPSRGIKQSHLLDQLFTWGKLGSKPIHPLPSPWISFPGLTITSPALCILYGTVFTAFLSTFGRARGPLPTKHRPPIPMGLPLGGKGTVAQLGKLLNPPVRLSRANEMPEHRTNDAAQDKVSQKGLNETLCSRTTIWARFFSEHC